MFERFRRSHGTESGARSVAVREREEREDARDEDVMSGEGERVDSAPVERISPGERDRAVVAGDGERDLEADRPFERDEMARGATGDGDGDGDGDGADRSGGGRFSRVSAGERGDTGRGDDAALGRHAARDDLSADATEDRAHTGPGESAGERDPGMAAEEDAGAAARRDDGEGAVARERGHGYDRARMRELAAGRTARGERDDTDADADGTRRHAPVLATDALDTMRARQRDRFGGIHWGSDFFGWLCAIGLASILTAILVGAGVALGLSTDDAGNSGSAQKIGLGGGIALLVVLAIAWFCGGYVAGRMARFDGARQGIGVWLWTILAAVVVAALAAIGGSQYDIFQRLNLPRIAVGGSTLTAGGAIAGAAAIVVTLLAAIVGGKVGERFHRRVDRVATDEYVVDEA